MPATRRRVSYIIPPPSEPVPVLQLPPHGLQRTGATGPLLIPAHNSPDRSLQPPTATHPRHRLGVACLALDTSTVLTSRNTPEGILYTGGRDGLVMAWDLAIPMKRRPKHERPRGGRWEVITGWADDTIEEEFDDAEEPRSDGDVLGDVEQRRRRRKNSSIPYEHQWETDTDAIQGDTTTQFRQCAQVHSDWVNDMLLCNLNQTVVTASSDGTVKAWSPHASSPSEPTTIGSHADYVRCLAHCRDQNWVASGSFDRTIRLWDLARPSDPLITLSPPEASGPKASVYALATDPYGAVIASGSPERVIRMWDPRSGKRIAKLVGHTDNIRAILVSDDAKYLLTGSADASIKLWSLSSQRCLHTFTYHTDSVWSLFSSHPSLETFYSGDRSGIVCKVDVEACGDISDGDCVVLCQDPAEGINKLWAMDDYALWTASVGSSSVKRWRLPSKEESRRQEPLRRTSRSFDLARSRTPPSVHQSLRSPSLAPSEISALDHDQEQDNEHERQGVPYDSRVRLTSPHDTFSSFGVAAASMATARGRDPEIATLYSAASVMSIPRITRSPVTTSFPQPAPVTQGASSSPTTNPSSTLSPTSAQHLSSTLHPQAHPRVAYLAREVAADAIPLRAEPAEVMEGSHGLVRSLVLNDRMHVLTVDTAGGVAVWDVVRGICLGTFSGDDVREASFHGGSGNGGEAGVNERNRDREREGEKGRSPREALESVRERIEGEAVVPSWASVDTKTGCLSVHLSERCFEAEIYADEAGYGSERQFSDEVKLNVGKWVLRNLFLGFIREQQRAAARRSRDSGRHDSSGHRLQRGSTPSHIELATTASGNGHQSPDVSSRVRTSSDISRRSFASPKSATIIASPNMLPAVSPSFTTMTHSSPLVTPMIPLNSAAIISLSPIPQSPNSTDATPTVSHGPRRSQTLDSVSGPGSGAPTKDSTAPPSATADYFSLRTRRPSVTAANGLTTPDDFSGWGGPGKSSASANVNVSNDGLPQTPITPTVSTAGGLMGRLKAFGKGAVKRQTGDVAGATPGAVSVGAESSVTSGDASTPSAPKTPLQDLLSGTLVPPSSTEAPPLPLAGNTAIVISEEAQSGWTTLYRGQVSSTGADARTLEDTMPIWLLEYLLVNRVPPVTVTKISFVLLPYPNKDPEGEQLPELLNTAQSKLTASRFLRVRKLTYHVQEKLDKIAGGGRTPAANTPRSSIDGARSASSVGREGESNSRPRPEEAFEILCNDVVLPLDTTLAAVRQFVWRQAAELVMHYRRKVVPAVPASSPPAG